MWASAYFRDPLTVICRLIVGQLTAQAHIEATEYAYIFNCVFKIKNPWAAMAATCRLWREAVRAVEPVWNYLYFRNLRESFECLRRPLVINKVADASIKSFDGVDSTVYFHNTDENTTWIKKYIVHDIFPNNFTAITVQYESHWIFIVITTHISDDEVTDADLWGKGVGRWRTDKLRGERNLRAPF
jgi:hypothetical protein